MAAGLRGAASGKGPLSRFARRSFSWPEHPVAAGRRLAGKGRSIQVPGSRSASNPVPINSPDTTAARPMPPANPVPLSPRSAGSYRHVLRPNPAPRQARQIGGAKTEDAEHRARCAGHGVNQNRGASDGQTVPPPSFSDHMPSLRDHMRRARKAMDNPQVQAAQHRASAAQKHPRYARVARSRDRPCGFGAGWSTIFEADLGDRQIDGPRGVRAG